MNQLSYFIFRILKFAIIFYILFLVFTNLGTVLLVLAGIFLALYFLIYSKVKEIKKRHGGANNFHFKFNARDFQDFQNSRGHQGYDFGQGGQSSISEIQEAKVFFGFENLPTEQELKKKYRELAKKYHPDINGGDDANMQKLNHYRDVLVKSMTKD
ncbi:J domain-containing protein [Arcobacter sp. HD9-500m-PIT-SAG03]|nr:J domain-containing protein [Arcobacter sp. HD9-500m-PIT-SAG03]